MGSLIVVLVAVAAVCYGEAYQRDVLPTINGKLEDTVESNEHSRAIERGPLGRSFWGNFNRSPRKPEEPKSPMDDASNETSNEASRRKSRFLGSLAFLAGLSFGGLATAASTTAKTFAKLPSQGSFTLNLGSSKASPYFAAYYNPYSLLPYPFLYPGPVGLVPAVDPARPQSSPSHGDPTAQLIGVFDNKSVDDAENNEEYIASADRKSDESANLRADADWNAEEKAVIHGCKESQKRYELLVDADGSRATLNFRVANATDAPAGMNQTTMTNATTTTTTNSSQIEPTSTPTPVSNHTVYPYFPGYYGGYPQNINHVDLTTGSNAYGYGNDHGHVNYNLPYERPANFYHDGKYDVYSSHYDNPYLSGSFPADQNEYANFNQVYHPSEYQTPYSHGFRPTN